MKWVDVKDYLPPIGVEVLCFRPDAIRPLKLLSRKANGDFHGYSKLVTHWLDMDMPPGWTDEHGKRQHD